MECFIVTQHGQRHVQATGTPLWLPGPAKLAQGYRGLTVPAYISFAKVDRLSENRTNTVYLESIEGKVIVHCSPGKGFVTAKLPTTTLNTLIRKVAAKRSEHRAAVRVAR